MTPDAGGLDLGLADHVVERSQVKRRRGISQGSIWRNTDYLAALRCQNAAKIHIALIQFPLPTLSQYQITRWYCR